MTKEEARAYFIDNNEKIISVDNHKSKVSTEKLFEIRE